MYSNPKILLVDDNKDLLQIIQIILKGQGYETVLASSLKEAEQKLMIHKPALIMMDVFLSDEDGRVFCNRIKNDPELGAVRVIMMSGLDDSLDLMHYVYADDFMQKPFDYNDLLERVQKQLYEYRLVSVNAE